MDIEKYFDFKGIKGRYQRAVAEKTAEALMLFCKQEPEFEQAIEQSGKTFQECLNYVVKGCGNSISDLDAFKKAAKFYFSTATVHFNMSIDLSGDNGHTDPPIRLQSCVCSFIGLTVRLTLRKKPVKFRSCLTDSETWKRQIIS